MVAAPITIFSTPFAQAILVFILIFTIIFAILQKSEILGKGKKQIDALVSFAMGLIVISVGYALNIITSLIPILAVTLVIILIFLILLALLFKEKSFDVPGWLKVIFGIIIALVVIVAVLIVTGGYDYLASLFSINSSLVGNAVLIIIVIVAIVAALSGGTEDKSKS